MQHGADQTGDEREREYRGDDPPQRTLATDRTDDAGERDDRCEHDGHPHDLRPERGPEMEQVDLGPEDEERNGHEQQVHPRVRPPHPGVHVAVNP